MPKLCKAHFSETAVSNPASPEGTHGVRHRRCYFHFDGLNQMKMFTDRSENVLFASQRSALTILRHRGDMERAGHAVYKR